MAKKKRAETGKKSVQPTPKKVYGEPKKKVYDDLIRTKKIVTENEDDGFELLDTEEPIKEDDWSDAEDDYEDEPDDRI